MAKKKNSKVCVLSDQTQNDYGFIVITGGIDLTRFNSNPVFLKQHCQEVDDVIGRIDEVHIEGEELLGVPVFDVEDEEVKPLAGKWDRGFLNALSIGFAFDPSDLIIGSDGVLVLTKCELYEVSLVAIGSNRNAVKLYSKQTQKWLDDKEIATLSSCLEITHVEKPEINTMAKIILSNLAVANHLGLKSSEADQTEIEAKIVDLHTAKLSAEAEAKKYKEQIEEFKTAELSAKKTKADNFVNKLITEGKLKASDTTEVERFRKLATDDFEFAESLASKLAGKSNLSSNLQSGKKKQEEVEDEDLTFDYLQKHDTAKLASIQANDPELYSKLASDYRKGVRYKK